jgi:two-component system, chemotaxis family, CheB/CheR fusion protein
LTRDDVGRPLQDLQISYRPIDLRSCLDRIRLERRPVTMENVEWQPPSSSEACFYDIQLNPLLDRMGKLLGASITFTDVSAFKRLRDDLEHANREIETANAELQSTNEELETTNEELQSTNEELETTNEELQSTNEEMETMNEELQSTNEELETLNVELCHRSEEFNELNSFLESILAGVRCGIAVLDGDQLIRKWNLRAEELWGLRADEVQGKHFFNLNIGLPIEQLRQPIRHCLDGQEKDRELSLSAINRVGKSIECKVTCSPLVNRGENKAGVILLMEEDVPHS